MNLPFSYDCDKSIAVYEQSKAFIEQTGIERDLAEIAWAYHSIGGLIPQTSENFWSGHFFPWQESWEELQISFNLCLFGLYKQAMSSLRSCLELGLLSVYWNLNDDGHTVIQEWLKSRENTPRSSDVWKKLEKHDNFKTFQQRYDIRTRLLALGFLHDYVHTRGHQFSNSIGLFKSNFQTFEQKGFEDWRQAYAEVVIVLSILHLVKFPIGTIKFDYSSKFGIDTPMFGGIDEFQVDRLENFISSQIFQNIEFVAQGDHTVKNIMEWVANLPDMTEEEGEDQIRNFDKRRIEQMGFEEWIKEEQVFRKGLETTHLYTERLNSLKEWATEQGYLRPRHERDIS